MKMDWFVKYIFLLLLLLFSGGCKEKMDGSYVIKVIDLTGEEEQELKLEYDQDGNIIKYGKTSVKYEGDLVIIGEPDEVNSGNRLNGVIFEMGKGKAQESRAYCRLAVKDSIYEVEKHTFYEYEGDTLHILSDYRDVSAHRRLLRNVKEKYIFDKEGRLKEVTTLSTEGDNEVSSCHIYYNYDKNISCRANLNLQAYLIEREQNDGFFYFLLNLGQFKNKTALPNDIDYSVNHGAQAYNIHANYQLENENLVKIEVLYNYTKLLSRIGLFYLPSD